MTDLNQVASLCVSSSFLGSSSVKFILESFLGSVNKLDIEAIPQISMDGSNEHWSFLRLVQEKTKMILAVNYCLLDVVDWMSSMAHQWSQSFWLGNL